MIVYELSNCSVSPRVDNLDSFSSEVLFTITTNNGYIFNLPPRFFCTLKGETQEKSYPFIVDSTNTIATYSFDKSLIDESKYISIFGKGVKGQVANAVTIEYDLTDCTAIEKPLSIKDGDELKIVLSANEGYHFELSKCPTFYYQDSFYASIPFNISDDGKTATLDTGSKTVTERSSLYKVVGTAVPIPISNTLDYINAYNLTKDELRQLAEKPFPKWDSNSGFQIDYRSFIIRLMYVPAIPVRSKEKTEIYSGFFNTDVTAFQILEDTITQELGTLTIGETYGNAIDYMGRATLYLPYMGIYDVPIVDIMNKTIRLVYHINVINGTALAELVDTENNITVFQVSDNVSENISFSMNEMTLTLQKDSKTDATSYMGNTPYLVLHNKIPAETPDSAINHKRVLVRIGTIIGKGFVSGEIYDGNIEDDTITNMELSEIKSLFSDGVIV